MEIWRTLLDCLNDIFGQLRLELVRWADNLLLLLVCMPSARMSLSEADLEIVSWREASTLVALGADQSMADLHQPQKCSGCVGITKSPIPFVRDHSDRVPKRGFEEEPYNSRGKPRWDNREVGMESAPSTC